MLSPLNVDVCLTEPSPACDRTEPDKYYPIGARNYARLAPNLIFEAAALAQLAQPRRGTRVPPHRPGGVRRRDRALSACSPRARNPGRRLPLVAPDDPSYAALFRDVARSDADAILLAGVPSQDGARLIREKVGVLGTNAKVKLLAPDAFAEQALLDEAGAAAHGMYVVAPGVALRAFPPRARVFARRFSAERLGGAPVDPYALHGAEAIRLLLDALARSDGSRAGVRRALFATTVSGGLLGRTARRKRRSGKRARPSGGVHCVPRRRALCATGDHRAAAGRRHGGARLTASPRGLVTLAGFCDTPRA